MTRDELIKANEALLARRKREVTSQPQPIEAAIQTVANRDGMTLEDYYNALNAGTLVSENAQPVNTSRARWDSFDSDRHPALKKGVKVIKRWYNDRLDLGGALILAGNCGCGKTHLAQAIYDLYGYGAIYLNEIEMVSKIQASFGGAGGQSLESITNYTDRARLIIYDDLGAYETDNSQWMQNIYMKLFSGRHEAGKAALITTNLKNIDTDSEGQVFSPLTNRLGQRVYSRLMGAVGEMKYFIDLFSVPDYRLRNF
jgi:DNA replication protein DnaC